MDAEHLRSLLERGHLDDFLRALPHALDWELRPNRLGDGHTFIVEGRYYTGPSPIAACLAWLHGLRPRTPKEN